MASRGFGVHGGGSISHWTQDRPPEKGQVCSSHEIIACADKGSPAISLKPATSSLAQQIIDDSSLAATLATNSDRHLFFQAPRGSIRRMIYTANEAQWIADPNPIAVSDAKMLTPMAVSTLTALKAVNSSEQLISDTVTLSLPTQYCWADVLP